MKKLSNEYTLDQLIQATDFFFGGNLMENSDRTFSDQVFDNLSAVPYLKIVLKCLWRFAVVYTPSIYLVGFCLQGIDFFRIPNTGKTWILYFIGVICFGYIFKIWDRRDVMREKSS